MMNTYGYWNGSYWVYPGGYPVYYPQYGYCPNPYTTYISYVPVPAPDQQAKVTEQLLKRIADLEARLDSK
jgi:hypothetical protein